jgi:phosphoribosyl 1,2-cyclic phosphodiesterase
LIAITFIGSGSKGNSALLEIGDSYFLLDVGFSCRHITEFLKTRGLGLEDLSGVFITHEHDDHIKGLKVCLKKVPELKVYSSAGTLAAIRGKDIEMKNTVQVKAGRSLSLSGVELVPFNVPHDACEPFGYRFECGGKVISVASDLGSITPEVLDCTIDSDILCLESNYDKDMLRVCSYPPWLKSRIMGPQGHLPNGGVRGVLSKMNKTPESLVLIHLSQESNRPHLAREALSSFVDLTTPSFKETKIFVASQDFASERICIEG